MTVVLAREIAGRAPFFVLKVEVLGPGIVENRSRVDIAGSDRVNDHHGMGRMDVPSPLTPGMEVDGIGDAVGLGVDNDGRMHQRASLRMKLESSRAVADAATLIALFDAVGVCAGSTPESAQVLDVVAGLSARMLRHVEHSWEGRDPLTLSAVG